ncbi:DNA gyrase subunit A [Candidatus Shikimatogenerans bostrichidophilus]|uniref:DNA gyrase subunit A n=1 Tax=Candidatus Shikimatogenerans bostrichidophilus TaxID=2943807 RepID=UPI0029676E4D
MNKIKNININDEIKSSYIDYAMSVIISRALPDVRDGLKPVHRRILYSMYKLGLSYNKGYKKSARIVGEVLGKYHPHGDKSVYDSIVRMAQPWNLRYNLISGQGNFGSIDADPPAAMRYTEIKLAKITEEMLKDINKKTIDMKLNFDNTLKEPVILPTKIPNLLINGISGIAVGMATNMPPHNINDTIDTICKYIDNKKISTEKLIKYIKAPDFPTGGIINLYKGVKEAYKKGKGKIIISSKYYVIEKNNKKYIIIKEIPYQVIKSNLIKKIFNLIKNNKINEIENIKDESNKKGIRILLTLKKYCDNEKVINKLLKYTDLQISYHINNIALVNGRPKRLNLKKLIYYFIEHRNNVIIKKAKYNLYKLKNNIHVFKGFIKISNSIDKLFKLIKKSSSYIESFNKIKNNFDLTKKQIKFILNIKLYKFTNKEIKNLIKKYKKLKKKIIINKKIINLKKLRMNIIKKELYKIKKLYGDKRKTLYNDENDENDKNDEEKNKKNELEKKKYLLFITHKGYIKRTLLKKFKNQNRGGKGYKGITINKNDYIENIKIGNINNYILLFTKLGKCFLIKMLIIPKGNKLFKGRAIQNFIDINNNERIKSTILIDNKKFKNIKYLNNNYIIISTKKGIVKKTILSKFFKPRKNGINSIILKKNDFLIEAKLNYFNGQILIAINSGKIIRFNENNIKLTERYSVGVKGITIKNKKDKAIGILCINNNENNKYILVVTENGYGKRSIIKNYKITNRGGIGMNTIKITKKTGKLISIKKVSNEDEIIIIKKLGNIIRFNINSIRITSRNSQGVKLIKINNNDKIADIIIINKYEK